MIDKKRLGELANYTAGGILSGIIMGVVQDRDPWRNLKVSAFAGLTAGVILEIFTLERKRRFIQRIQNVGRPGNTS